MKKLTLKWLKNKEACQAGIAWLGKQNTEEPKELFRQAIEEKKYNDINWVLVRMMNKKQKVTYAIYAAEQVLHIFENKHPEDPRPRKAIDAAKAYLKNPCARTRQNALAAAADADAAADDAAADAAYAAYATYAADAADAADAAAAAAAADDADADAAAAAAYADDAADDAAADADDADAYAARGEVFKKILNFGYELIFNN